MHLMADVIVAYAVMAYIATAHVVVAYDPGGI